MLSSHVDSCRVVSISALSVQLKADAVQRAKWQEAMTNLANKTMRQFKASSVEDGYVFNVKHVKHATVFNDLDYKDAMRGTPAKKKDTRGIKTMMVPSHSASAEEERVTMVLYIMRPTLAELLARLMSSAIAQSIAILSNMCCYGNLFWF